MSLIVETGDGIVNANSYGTAAEWKAYWVAVGYDFSAYTNSEIEVALIRATRYVESRFRNLFYGWRETEDQALSWPRVGVIINCLPQDGLVPQELKNATFEYAKRALPATAELQPDPVETDASGQRITSFTKKIGPITKQFEYASGGALTLRSYPAADQWLSNLVCFGEGVIHN